MKISHNGLTTFPYGESSLIVYRGNKEIFHTSSRRCNTENETLEFLNELPDLLECLFNGGK